MKYNNSYHTNCVLTLEGDLDLTLDSLVQRRTYEGLLEGTPDCKTNDRSIEMALERAKNIGFGKKPFLVIPKRRDYLREPGDMQSVLKRQESRPEKFRRIPEWLPQIECIAKFHANQPVRDKSMHGASLTIVWYQEKFGIEEVTSDLITLADWESNAIDFEY